MFRKCSSQCEQGGTSIKIGIWPQISLRTVDTISINNSILNPGPGSKVSPGVKKIIDQPVLYVTVCHVRCKNGPATNIQINALVHR